tara:strand:- start:44 stop:259 length:216 start_codon:yes stop_codon:yes gene_type:complete
MNQSYELTSSKIANLCLDIDIMFEFSRESIKDIDKTDDTFMEPFLTCIMFLLFLKGTEPPASKMDEQVTMK